MRPRYKLCNLAVVIAAAFSANANAFEPEVAIGRSAYCCKIDSIWWQSPLGFQGDLNPTAIQIGFTQSIYHGWTSHSAFVDLGKATGSNWAAVPDDQFNNPTTAQLGHFTASQKVRGFLTGVSYRWKLTEKVSVEPEIGQFFYRSNWRIDIYCPTLCAGNVPQSYQSFRYVSKIRRSLYEALTVSYGSAFITYRRFNRIDGGGDPAPDSTGQFATGLTSGPVNNWMVGIRASF